MTIFVLRLRSPEHMLSKDIVSSPAINPFKLQEHEDYFRAEAQIIFIVEKGVHLSLRKNHRLLRSFLSVKDEKAQKTEFSLGQDSLCDVVWQCCHLFLPFLERRRWGTWWPRWGRPSWFRPLSVVFAQTRRTKQASSNQRRAWRHSESSRLPRYWRISILVWETRTAAENRERKEWHVPRKEYPDTRFR